MAAGRSEAHFEEGLDIWDVAAAQLIVREAGGVVTDLEGRPMQLLDFEPAPKGAGAMMVGNCEAMCSALCGVLASALDDVPARGALRKSML